MEKAHLRVISAQRAWKGWLVCFCTGRRAAAAGVVFINTQLHSVAVTCCFLSEESSARDRGCLLFASATGRAVFKVVVIQEGKTTASLPVGAWPGG